MYNTLKGLFDVFQPPCFESTNWKNWIAVIDEKTCVICREHHGKIYPIGEILQLQPPVHIHCRCELCPVKAALAGTATNDGLLGADYFVKTNGKLPDNYITVEEAKKVGWKNILGNLNQVAPGKQITNGTFYNREGKLPYKNGRTWIEADINYVRGYRNGMRIVVSNDGLIFVTYDHYQTFYEIV